MFPWLSAVPWRLVAYSMAAVAVLALGWRVHAWREGYLALPAAQEALQREQDCAEGSRCIERVKSLQARSQAVTDAKLKEYEDEVASLRSRPVERRVIRVCPDPGANHLRDATVAGQPASPEAPGVFLEPREFDTQGLRDAAAEADEINAAYRFVHGRDTALATAPK